MTNLYKKSILKIASLKCNLVLKEEIKKDKKKKLKNFLKKAGCYLKKLLPIRMILVG